MRAGKSLFIFIASIVIIPFAAQNYIAEEACDHQWDLDYSYYEYVNATQHKRTETFYCPYCGEYKTTETLQNHAWKYEDSDDYYDISATQHGYSKYYYCTICGDSKTETAKSAHKWVLEDKYYYEEDVKSISPEQHSYISSYYCDICERYKYPSATENHKFDKYGICQICDYYKTSTITLKSNSTVGVNEKRWVKVIAPKKGLLYLYGKGGYNSYINLYNSKKRKYPNLYYYLKNKGKVIIPVSKGTYYLKTDECIAIKYVFKADPSKKNYTKKKAISIKPNKTYTTVIYSGDKKNTWNRYFKIKLTKKQRITILPATTDYFAGEFTNAKGQYISTSFYYDKNGKWVGYTTDRKLPKGTYYLKISASWTSVTRKQTTGFYYSFKWK